MCISCNTNLLIGKPSAVSEMASFVASPKCSQKFWSLHDIASQFTTKLGFILPVHDPILRSTKFQMEIVIILYLIRSLVIL